MLNELYAHQEWADATIWRSVVGEERARIDQRVRDLLAHLHATQHAFLAVWSGTAIDYRPASSFSGTREVLPYARAYHDGVRAHLASLDDALLDQPLVLPWATRYRKDAWPTTRRDTLLQVPMHSTYHRGQVNARLRELGCEPPLVDFIAWVWRGRPAAQWP